MVVQTWGDIFVASFQALWLGVASFLPRLIVALIVFLIGWVIAVAIGKLVSQIIRAIKVDRALQGVGIEEPLSRAGFRLDSGAFIGGLVRWFFIAFFLLVAIDALGLQQVTVFLREVVLVYLPNVVVAAIILVIAALLADVMQRVVRGSAQAAHLPSSAFLGGVTKWSIWLFALLAALFQLGIAGPLLQDLFRAFVAMLAVAGGLAFGLGGKDHASRFIERLRQDITHS